MFAIRFEKPAEKYIEKLKENPFPPEAVRVEEYKKEKVFRVRMGYYRILYYVEYSMSLIVITNIDKRARAY